MLRAIFRLLVVVAIAAEQGDPDAQDFLGSLHFNGWGVPRNDREAVKWYRKAAEQGKAHAQWNLAVMYRQGWGVLKYLPEAHAWMNLAAAQGDKRAVRDRDKLERQMTPEQITQAQALAAKLHKRIEARTALPGQSKGPQGNPPPRRPNHDDLPNHPNPSHRPAPARRFVSPETN